MTYFFFGEHLYPYLYYVIELDSASVVLKSEQASDRSAPDRLFISAGESACREPRVHLGSLAVCDFDLAHRFPSLFLIDHREREYPRSLTVR